MDDYRYLGHSGLKISPLTLGTMMFGGVTDEAESRRIIESARDYGINSIDTADVYNAGQSEVVVGKAIKAQRDYWVLATKLANRAGSGPNQGGLSRKWIIEQVDHSLRRLGTDYIDILYFHRAIFGVRLDEPVRAVGDLIRQGKIRYFGISNFRGWRIAEVCRIADMLGVERPIASQPLYNIVTRQAEVEELPAAAHYGLGVISYSPLARGVLTGKYRTDSVPQGDSRAGRADKRLLETEWRTQSLEVAEKIRSYIQKRGISIADFAVAWVLGNRLVTSTIAGPRTEEQWAGYLQGRKVSLTKEDEEFIDTLVAPGHASTPGFSDPGHPVEGRVVRA
ncbi:aldo/keto reductase [Novacetimonas hansenii]|uniref:aldo/keto reductase n=1 Tax=Novacetimonas hansenii TaxID=436 RepID=UPI00094F7E6A|nr:aldo/keto reductase [Novacetimonas hansenii]PYD71979.1 NADP-dependent oxidoreductase [Novacetimonas hansenii]